ncbi:universal stress protein [Corallococcus carmarthensis]|uniref:Universal stress protein n=1 Tax=Corallococcus carmarthensis TaxID=2316728 RepID=A0A3A8JZA0_9BACT|nr:universal stress protein [Corallococcus carmarthensis]NOK20138.1 universal stress protein [Corallococcus carmarthensis]RKG97140.1 universal stress protein [Corallococcus carmarthensis]
MAIVCAVDFSEGSRQAARVAALLAARRSQPLWLVHQVHPDQLRVAAEPVREGLQALLREEAARLEPVGARVRVLLLENDSPRALANVCAAHEARLLVVGSPRGEEAALGSGVSLERIARNCAVPLLRVRDAAPFEAWLSGKRPLRVMLGVDRSHGTEAARRWLAELRAAGPLELLAGHVYYAFEQCRRLGLPTPMNLDEVAPRIEEVLHREVAALAATEAGPAPRVHLRMAVGRAADHLVDLAREQEADVLVVGTHPHTSLGNLASVSHHALRLAPMSAAVVPVNPAASRGEAPIPQLRRLLVATDLSPLADEAIPFAFALAPAGSEVHLVTVVPERSGADLHQDLKGRLLERVPRGLESREVVTRVEVLHGEDVALTLAQAAERLDADLLCLGSRGHGGLKEALLGSVARQLLSQSRRPVLVLRPPVR